MSILKTTAIVLAAGMVTAVSAFAASPKPGHSYQGTGTDFMNNAPTWADEATGKIKFQTSTNGLDVMQFKGTFSYYCGAGTSDVTEKKMAISKSGRFGARFSQKVKGANGKVNSTAYVAVSGRFEDGGSQASVSYLVDYVFAGSKVSHPYSTSDPRALGCASWVRGTVRTS
jgi:hypothetical protein